ncbi:hypothetical protein ACQI4E_17095 [Streptomyces sp. CA-252508]|uniref:hypothetical protein n=1 Tax=Streptomyces sp. CA-252508 TaxID=3418946 RepID=UPI003D917E17
MSRDRKPRDGDTWAVGRAGAGADDVRADGASAGPAELLAAAVLGGAVDPAGEERAVAAFRAARDEGLHAGRRSRRRDDWRPERERRRLRSLRVSAMGLAATVLLGGVAVAAQTGALGSPFGGAGGGAAPERRPSTVSPYDSDVSATPLAEQEGPAHAPARTPGTVVVPGVSPSPAASGRPGGPSAPESGAGAGPKAERKGKGKPGQGADTRKGAEPGPEPTSRTGRTPGAPGGGKAGDGAGSKPHTRPHGKPGGKGGAKPGAKPHGNPDAEPGAPSHGKGGGKTHGKDGGKSGAEPHVKPQAKQQTGQGEGGEKPRTGRDGGSGGGGPAGRTGAEAATGGALGPHGKP